MRHAKRLVRLLGVLTITLALGCASAYRDYSEGSVNCRYCVPPPLPYMQYDGCVCHSSAASKYLGEASAPLPAETIDPLFNQEQQVE